MCGFRWMAHLMCGFGSMIVRFFACLSCVFGSVNVMSYTTCPSLPSRRPRPTRSTPRRRVEFPQTGTLSRTDRRTLRAPSSACYAPHDLNSCVGPAHLMCILTRCAVCVTVAAPCASQSLRRVRHSRCAVCVTVAAPCASQSLRHPPLRPLLRPCAPSFERETSLPPPPRRHRPQTRSAQSGAATVTFLQDQRSYCDVSRRCTCDIGAPNLTPYSYHWRPGIEGRISSLRRDDRLH